MEDKENNQVFRTILEAGSVWRKSVKLVTLETIIDKKLMTPGAEQPNV